MSLTPSIGVVFAAFLWSRTPCFLGRGGGGALSRSPHISELAPGTGLCWCWAGQAAAHTLGGLAPLP